MLKRGIFLSETQVILMLQGLELLRHEIKHEHKDQNKSDIADIIDLEKDLAELKGLFS